MNHLNFLSSLSNNDIGVVGGKALAGMIAKNKSLQEVSIGKNKIGDIGATEFVKAVGSNASLKTIRYCLVLNLSKTLH